MSTLQQIGQYAYSHTVTIQSSYDLAVHMIENKIDGDFVECGVAAGAQLMSMALANKDKSGDKIFWGFDSFIGIPMAGEFDDSQPAIGEITHDKFAPLSERLISSGITAHSLESVIQNFTNYGLYSSSIHFVEGWFQDTLPLMADKIEKISILRLDGDLYESTLVCLEHLYPKVCKGGAVIIDDYGLTGCRIAVEHYFKSINESVPEMICVDGHSVHYFIK